MATTSTVPIVIDALLTAFGDELPGDVNVYEAWPGPEASDEMVVFGEVRWEDYVLATVMQGRRQRQEDYEFDFEVYVAPRPGSTPSNPKPTRDRAFSLLSDLEDVLAENPRTPSNISIQSVQVSPTEAGPREFEKSWFYRIAGVVTVAARLV